jgi:hypothetical protein
VWYALTKSEWTKQYMYVAEVISDFAAEGDIIWRCADDGKNCGGIVYYY